MTGEEMAQIREAMQWSVRALARKLGRAEKSLRQMEQAMFDVFINTQAPITDVPAFLAGVGGQRVRLRDGGPTQVWERQAGNWRRDERPGLILFEDLCPNRVEFSANRLDGVMADLVQGGMTLGLDSPESAEWFDLAGSHRYRIEDGIGCSCNVDHEGGVIEMAMSELDPSISWVTSIRTATLVANWWGGLGMPLPPERIGLPPSSPSSRRHYATPQHKGKAMSEKERYQIAVDARLCGARNGMVIVLVDGSRWRLSGLTIQPVADARR